MSSLRAPGESDAHHNPKTTGLKDQLFAAGEGGLSSAVGNLPAGAKVGLRHMCVCCCSDCLVTMEACPTCSGKGSLCPEPGLVNLPHLKCQVRESILQRGELARWEGVIGRGRSLEGQWPGFAVHLEFWSEGPEDQVQDDSLTGQMPWESDGRSQLTKMLSAAS